MGESERVPEGLGESGRALWTACRPERLHVAHRGLVLQAARLLDRLDTLAAQLDGRQADWLWAMEGGDGKVEVYVDKALAEARQYAVAYAQICDKMRQMGILGVPKEEQAGPSLVEQLKKAREERERRARPA